MREVNKDLKIHFAKLQKRINDLEARDREQGYFAAHPGKHNRRYDSSEEEENERHHSQERRPAVTDTAKTVSH